MRLASFALLTASAISLVTAAPAPPADPNIFNLPGSASQGGNKVVLPATNININRQDISNLIPSKTLTLQYAEGITSGTYAASLKFKMMYPQAVLENSALVTTLDCSKDSQTMTIVFQSKAAYDVAALWPQTKLVLITNNAACNPSTERGIYMVNGHKGIANTLTIILQVSAKTWADVAETMELTYGNLISKTTFTASSSTSKATSKTSSTSLSTSSKSSSTSLMAISKTNSQTTHTTTAMSSANKVVCNNDNCLRGLTGNKAAALGFCKTYTTAIQTSLGPSYVPASCLPARLSSACTCFVQTQSSSSSATSSPASTKSVSTTSGTASISSSVTSSAASSTSTSATSSMTGSTSSATASSTTSSTSVSATSSMTSSTSSAAASSTTSSTSVSATSSMTSSTTSSATSMTGSSTNIPVADVTSMSPAQQSIYNIMQNSLVKDGAGDIILNLGPLARQTPIIIIDSFQPDNATYQQALQDALTADGFDSVDTLLQAAVNDLASASGSAYAITPGMGIKEILPQGWELYTGPVGKRSHSSRKFEQEYAPSTQHLSKRFSLSDALSLGNDILTNDLVDAICEPCNDFSDAENGYNAAVALYQMTHPRQEPPAEIATVSITSNAQVTVPANYPLYNDKAGNSINCANCGLSVSSIDIQGQVMVVLATNSILFATLNVTYDATSNLVLGLATSGAASGSFDAALSTMPLTTLSSPGIFNIAPKIIYGVGASYQTDSAVKIQAGASMSLSNAFTSLDIQNSKGISASNWQPQGTITYPSFSTDSRVTLTPYIKTAIEFTAQILGQTFDNAATITTQTNLGFDTQVLTAASQYKARSLERRFSLANILKSSSLHALLAKAAAAVANHVATPPTCPAGGLLLTGSMSTTNQAYFGSGSPVGLYSYSYPFGSRCFVVPGAAVPVPSSTSTNLPPTSAVSTIATSTLITSTISMPPVVFLSTTSAAAIIFPPTSSQPPAASTTSTSTPILPTTSTTTTMTAPQSASTTGFCPSGFTCGAITEGTSPYNLNCGMTMSSQTLEIGSAGPGANIHTMADCLDWCNRYGTYCQVALWDITQYNSCILFTGVGSTAISSTAAYAVRAVPPVVAAPYCPTGFSAGPISQGGSNYQLTCGKSMGGQDAAFASAGAPSGINTMGDCLNWCNSWGGACQVAEWDSSISYSCLLFGAVGAGTGSSTAAVAVRA